MPKPKAKAVSHAVTIPVRENIPPAMYLRMRFAHGLIDGLEYEIAGSVQGGHLILEIGARQFVISAEDALKSIFEQTRKGARKS